MESHRLHLGPLAPCGLSLEVHQNIHPVGAGLEHLGIGRAVALRLDHVGQFFGDFAIKAER